MLVVVDSGRTVKAKIDTVQLFSVEGFYDFLIDLHLVTDPEWNRERDPTLAHLRTTLDTWVGGTWKSNKIVYGIVPNQYNSRTRLYASDIIDMIKAREILIQENQMLEVPQIH